MAEEILVVLNKKDPTCGLGFSLLGTPGLPPIIYDVVENSPAAECGKVSLFFFSLLLYVRKLIVYGSVQLRD